MNTNISFNAESEFHTTVVKNKILTSFPAHQWPWWSISFDLISTRIENPCSQRHVIDGQKEWKATRLFGLAVSVWPFRSGRFSLSRFGHGTFRSDYESLQKSYMLTFNCIRT